MFFYGILGPFLSTKFTVRKFGCAKELIFIRSVPRYRNGQEFYRYIPTDTPDTTVFPYPGILVNVSRYSCDQQVQVGNSLVPVIEKMNLHIFRNTNPQRRE